MSARRGAHRVRAAAARRLRGVAAGAGGAHLSARLPPAGPVGGAPLPVTVRVLPFGIAAAYDSWRSSTAPSAYDVGIDPYNRWVANPASMIADLVARDMAASKTVRAVLQAASAVPYDYELSGHIETLEERDEGGSCSAMLRVRVALAHVPPRGPRDVVMQDIFTRRRRARRPRAATPTR